MVFSIIYYWIYHSHNDKPFGWVTLAGHATEYDCNKPSDVSLFLQSISKMKENTKLAIRKPRLIHCHRR